MKSYLVLLRGVNVGGKNTVSMPMLKKHLERAGFTDVWSYINSGNIILKSDKTAKAVQAAIEAMLPKRFKLESEIVKVLVLTRAQLESVVKNKPNGFGEEPHTYHSDVIFMMDTTAVKAIQVFSPRDGVDTIWRGASVIYSQRLSAKRTESRLNKIMLSPLYKSMTIRNWNTTTKLLARMRE